MQRRIIRTQAFRTAYSQLSADMRKIVEGKIQLLAANPAHPSLQVHRLQYIKAKKVWICYISVNNRLLYQYKDNAFYLWDVGKHSVVERVRQYHSG